MKCTWTNLDQERSNEGEDGETQNKFLFYLRFEINKAEEAAMVLP